VKNTWQVQDAKSRFSEFLNSCLTNGPQVVTRRGFEEAVLVPIEEWRKLNEIARPTLKSLLLSEEYKADLEIPQRGKLVRREIPKL
jgi:prevent-host-death family protein